MVLICSDSVYPRYIICDKFDGSSTTVEGEEKWSPRDIYNCCTEASEPGPKSSTAAKAKVGRTFLLSWRRHLRVVLYFKNLGATFSSRNVEGDVPVGVEADPDGPTDGPGAPFSLHQEFCV